LLTWEDLNMRRFASLLVLALICLTPTRIWAGDESLGGLDPVLDGGTECDTDGGEFIFCAPPPPPDAICREVLPVQDVNIPLVVEIDRDRNQISFTAGPAPFTVRTPADPIRPSTAGPDTQFLVMNVNAQQVITDRIFPAPWNGPVAPPNTFRGNASVMETRSMDPDFSTGYLYSASVTASYYIIRYYRDGDGVIQACPRILVACGYGGQEFYISP